MKLALEFVYFSKKSKILRQFLESTFGNVSEIESYQSFVRWKVEDHVKLSNLFGQMEANVISLFNIFFRKNCFLCLSTL